MSVLLKECFGEKKVVLLTKGADSKILGDLSENNNQKKTDGELSTNLNNFATFGYRTLCFSYKNLSNEMSTSELSKWLNLYNNANSIIGEKRETTLTKVIAKIETNYNLVGASAIEDKLQKEVPETIKSLRYHNIKFWMLTGDKTETAKNIGYSSNLICAVKNRVVEFDEGLVEEKVKMEQIKMNLDLRLTVVSRVFQKVGKSKNRQSELVRVCILPQKSHWSP